MNKTHFYIIGIFFSVSILSLWVLPKVLSEDELTMRVAQCDNIAIQSCMNDWGVPKNFCEPPLIEGRYRDRITTKECLKQVTYVCQSFASKGCKYENSFSLGDLADQ